MRGKTCTFVEWPSMPTAAQQYEWDISLNAESHCHQVGFIANLRNEWNHTIVEKVRINLLTDQGCIHACFHSPSPNSGRVSASKHYMQMWLRSAWGTKRHADEQSERPMCVGCM